MNCIICSVFLAEGAAMNYVCICNKCLLFVEKSEARMVEKICALTKCLQEQGYKEVVE